MALVNRLLDNMDPAQNISRCVCILAAASAGCTQDMYDQPHHEPLEASEFFQDGKVARQPVAGTVARGQLWLEDAYFTGRRDGQLVGAFPSDPRTDRPFAFTEQTLQHGRQQFDVFCSPCHGRTGYGDGMVVQRGFQRPPSLHSDKLRSEPPGFFFEVITNGRRSMPSFAASIAAEDRWAIVAYLRALRTSQRVQLDMAPEDIKQHFNEQP